MQSSSAISTASGAEALVPEGCPGCGGSLRVAGFGRMVCERCGTCWEPGRAGSDVPFGWEVVDTLACPGCANRSVCTSRPTWLVEERTHRHVLAGGAPVIIRPLLYSDRDELARGFTLLSHEARRRRFLVDQERLSDGDLEYLTNLDFHHHRAWAAFLPAEPGGPGVGVARWIRDRKDPEVAEVAATVLDAYQGRGIGTLLLVVTAGDAQDHGVRTLAGYVWWENDVILAPLRRLGARITGEEPGVARVEVDLPLPGPLPFRSRRRLA